MKNLNFLLFLIIAAFFISCVKNKQKNSLNDIDEYAIAYNVLADSQNNNYEVFTMNIDGSEKRNITNLSGVEWTYYAYKNRLFFISDRDTCQRCAYHLYETNFKGEYPRKIADLPLADSWL